MRMASSVASLVVFGVLLGEILQGSLALVVNCNPLELSPCASAMTSSSPPSPICNMLQQYMKDPNLQKLVNSPNANKFAATCGSPFPNC
ncbi:hypothetical protein MANES_06G065151v8 [Manihot esculenta]|uniref:Uncharacterized protein n=1 Tax=Manihot esculenta TaxID=3983 RepID=A0ACB7HJR2_MANES|nr:hypothetical protein MANES_06G065151v8 [Manihot esculenta]